MDLTERLKGMGLTERLGELADAETKRKARECAAEVVKEDPK